jgi:hypothetical protein
MQARDRQAMIDRVLAQPQEAQLPTRHHPMLSSRQPSDLGICTTRPSQPAYFAG